MEVKKEAAKESIFTMTFKFAGSLITTFIKGFFSGLFLTVPLDWLFSAFFRLTKRLFGFTASYFSIFRSKN